MDHQSEVFSLLGQMVSHPSVDGNEKSMSDFLAETARQMGMEVEQQEVLPGRCNVIARKTLGSGGKTVLLNSHMDVVPPAEGWDTDPYTLVPMGTRAYGRGSTDAKGGLACLMTATARILREPGELNGTILLTAVVDEESHSLGARKLVESGIQADYAIVGEPSMSRVAICHNGSIRPVIVVEGLAAHASNPQLGVNAISVAATVCGLVEEIAGELGTVCHPVTGHPTIAVTMIQGGLQENVLPDRCCLTIDRRMVPGEDEAAIKDRFEQVCRAAQERHPGSRVFVERYLVTTGPAAEIAPDSPLAQIAYRAAKEATGEDQSPYGLTCNTDMNHFVGAGIPTVIIGPGTITVAHKPNEYVELSELEKTCAVDEAVIRALLAQA